LSSPAAFIKNAEAAAPVRGGVAPAMLGSHKQPTRNPNQLPGRSEASPEVQQRLAQATVKIDVNQDGVISEWCSGVKININGTTYIQTAAHCFSQLTGSYDGHFSVQGAEAMNYNQAAGKLEYTIIDPSADPTVRDANPVALVTGISVDTNDSDIALLQVEPVAPVNIAPAPDGTDPEEGGPAYDGRSYNQIPAIDVLTKTGGTFPAPTPGDKIAEYGIPQTNNNNGVAAVGEYLGTILSYASDGTPYELYLVGINALNESQDECEFGASGSGALTEQGYLMGPLSIRNDPGSSYDLQIQQQRLLSEKGQSMTVNQLKSSWQNFRLYWERQLNVKMPYTTICGYTVPTQHTYQELVHGFNHIKPVDNFPSK